MDAWEDAWIDDWMDGKFFEGIFPFNDQIPNTKYIKSLVINNPSLILIMSEFRQFRM